MSPFAGPTGRVVRVLDRLACDPDKSFTLTELSRDLGISKATLHAIVKTLCAAGYLSRNPENPTYSLGPAAVRLGVAASGARGLAIDLATPVAVELSREFGECVLSAAHYGRIAVLVRAVNGSLDFRPTTHEPPLAAPVGSIFMAWADPPELVAWLARLDQGVDPQRRFKTLAALEAVRSRGYTIVLGRDPRTRLQAVMERAVDSGEDLADMREEVASLLRDLDDHHYMAADLDDAAGHVLDHIAAPVRDVSGRVLIAVTIKGFPPLPVARDYVQAAGERLLEAVTGISESLAAGAD